MKQLIIFGFLLLVFATLVSAACTTDSDCDDGLFCNGAETCNLETFECESGTPVIADDGVSCTVDSCDELNDQIVNIADDSLCNDSLFCNGVETCNVVLDCQSGAAPDLSDDLACSIDSCNEATDTIEHDLSPCKIVTIVDPTPGVFTERKLDINVESTQSADIFLSVDGKRFRKICRACVAASKTVNFRYGPHLVDVRAVYPNGEIREDQVRLLVNRENSVRGGTTSWFGIPVNVSLAQSSGAFKHIKSVNRRLRKEFLVTSIRLGAKNLPGIDENEEFGLWLHKSGTTDFLKLGNLRLNRKEPRSPDPFRTGIIGQYISKGQEFTTDLLAQFDGAFIEVEPADYALPYPSTEYVLYFNNPGPKNFLGSGSACINGDQCASGSCNGGLCS